MAGISGGCLCGAVKYKATKDPYADWTVVCHCTICQRQTGSAFATFVAFERGSVELTGQLTTYTEPGGVTGKPIERKFCARCGSPITVEVEGSPRTLIMAGTLDDTSGVKPAFNIFCESAQPRVQISEDTKNLPRYFT